MFPPIYHGKFSPASRETLEDDYALGVIAFQFLSGRHFLQAVLAAVLRFTKRLAVLILCGRGIESLLRV
jgi:hypothetical protein